MNIDNILASYNINELKIGVLGGHSALDTCLGAKKQGFQTVCIAKKGREQTYSNYYKSRTTTSGGESTGCIDECIVIDEWQDIFNIQDKLRKQNIIFIHNRYFWTYYDFNQIENNFFVPIFGSRNLLRLEERSQPNNQYWLLEKAGIRIPKIHKVPQLIFNNGTLDFEPPKELEGLVLTKVNNAKRTYERENFIATSWSEWKAQAENKLRHGCITLNSLQSSTIEDFILGAQINFNFFYSPLNQTLELIGTDIRRQTNLDGFLRLPASNQPSSTIYHIETGHIAVTCKESLLEKAFLAGENFVKACKTFASPIIGPFALQGAIETDGKKEEFIVFDTSLRSPGSPGIGATPYSEYLYGRKITMGERIAIEINNARKSNSLNLILT